MASVSVSLFHKLSESVSLGPKSLARWVRRLTNPYRLKRGKRAKP
jgi:hypothetical protein